MRDQKIEEEEEEGEEGNNHLVCCATCDRILQARGGFTLAATSETTAQRRVRHIILPADDQGLLAKLQEDLQGKA